MYPMMDLKNNIDEVEQFAEVELGGPPSVLST
jgi:hypothetical protein